MVAITKASIMKELIYKSFQYVPSSSVQENLNILDNFLQANAQELVARTEDEKDAVQEFERAFVTRFVHNSASIEGTTLTEIETELVLEGEFVPSDDKQVSDMFAVKGCAESYEYMLSLVEKTQDGCGAIAVDTSSTEQSKFSNDSSHALSHIPSENFIKDVHLRCVLDCQPRCRGVYRNIPVVIRGSKIVPANVARVRELMQDLIFDAENSQQHPIVKACAFHTMFENIHPFRDGNGRVGRAMLNYMLLVCGYRPVAIKNNDRAKYLSTLQSWQVDFEPEPFIYMVVESVLDETHELLDALQETRVFANGDK